MNEATTVDYPTNEELKDALLEIEGLSIEEETNDYFLTLDEYPIQNGFSDRFIRFNKENITIEDLIETFGEDISKLEIVEFLGSLPKVLLMNIAKIYFVQTEEQLTELYEDDKSPNHTFDLKHLGMFVWADGNVLISLPAHETVCEEIAKENLKNVGFVDYEEELKIAIFQTLAHELYHSLQENPLFEAEVEPGEEAAETYCRQLFK